MMKRLFLLFALLIFTGTVFAQEEEEAEDIPFVQLNANFSVPEIDWVIETGDESVWFVNRELSAQIYVTVVDTQDVNEAISSTIPTVSNDEFDAPFAETRIGRTTGTWTVQLFKSEDTSVTAYAMLQSGEAYVVLFAESSADYEAYHFPIRPAVLSPSDSELENTLLDASNSALSSVFSSETEAEISYPNPDSKYWLQAQYSDNLATASFLYDSIVFVTLLDGDTANVAMLSNAFDTVFLGFVITPSNIEFLYLGLAFSGAIMLALLVSMWLRYQNVLKDMDLVEHLAEE